MVSRTIVSVVELWACYDTLRNYVRCGYLCLSNLV